MKGLKLLEDSLVQVVSDKSRGGGLSLFDLRLFQFFKIVFDQNRFLGCGLEIGVWKGESSVALLSMLNANESLFLIDKYFRDDAQTFIDHFRLTHGLPAEVVCLAQDSTKLDFKKVCDGRELKVALVDGEHSYEAVYSDLRGVQSVMHDYGVCVVDDFFNIHSSRISQAVFDFTRESGNQLCVFAVTPNRAILVKRRVLGFYARAMESLISFMNMKGFMLHVGVPGFDYDGDGFSIQPLPSTAKSNIYQRCGNYCANFGDLLIR